MNPILVIPLALASGFFLARIPRISPGFPQALNRLVIQLLLPALTFVQLHPLFRDLSVGVAHGRTMALPASMAWALAGLSAAVFGFAGRKMRWDPKVTGAVILMAGFGNTSFVGYPVIQALHGEAGLRIAILADQPGSFLAVSTLGVLLAAAFSGRHESASAIARHAAASVLRFPAFYALLLAFFLARAEIPEVVLSVLGALGKGMAPLALVSVGFQWDARALLGRQGDARIRGAAALGLGFKLVLAPLLLAGLYAFFSDSGALDYRVTILEAAMAPMVTAGIVAAEAGLDRRVVVLMLGAGIPISFFTLPVWHFFLERR